MMITRRDFLKSTAAAGAVALAPGGSTVAAMASAKNAFSFVLLGDVHYDRPEHHDMPWVRENLPSTVSALPGFQRATVELLPKLFASLRDTIADLNRKPETRVPFVLQVGDLVQGACGNEELFTRHAREGIEFMRRANFGVPLLLTKGNHDIWGAGGKEAFTKVFHPFLTEETRALAPNAPAITSGRYTVEYANTQFAFFDAYDAPASLEWLEAVAARRTAEHFFVVIHPPVVPFGARSTWTIWPEDKDRARREKLLNILGQQHALVFAAHLHRYCTLGRRTPRGRFAQFALSTVLNNADPKPQLERYGLDTYNGDLVNVEPRFSPQTEQLRRQLFEAEKPTITSFEFADLPGWAVVTVNGPRVQIDMFSGVGRQRWRQVDFTGLLG
jgi:hypothetical protein